jgi:hypothetical protein
MNQASDRFASHLPRLERALLQVHCGQPAILHSEGRLRQTSKSGLLQRRACVSGLQSTIRRCFTSSKRTQRLYVLLARLETAETFYSLRLHTGQFQESRWTRVVTDRRRIFVNAGNLFENGCDGTDGEPLVAKWPKSTTLADGIPAEVVFLLGRFCMRIRR